MDNGTDSSTSKFVPEYRRTNFKNKGRFSADELRRRRDTQQVELRKAKEMKLWPKEETLFPQLMALILMKKMRAPFLRTNNFTASCSKNYHK